MLFPAGNQGKGFVYHRIPTRVWLSKFKNTFIQPKWLWPIVINDTHYKRILNSDHNPKFSFRWWIQSLMEHRIARKLALGMWPNIFIAREWADADIGKRHDPSNYTESGSHVDTLCNLVAQYAINKDSPILDIGCGCGRHFNQLVSMGFTNLHGVDACKKALELMPHWFPDTVGKVTTNHDLFQRYLSNVPDSFFDIVYTHCITIEEVHPSFNLVRHLSRITKNHVILLIDEHGGFSRFWEFEFRRQGFVPTLIMRPISSTTEPTYNKSLYKQGIDFIKSQPTMFVFTRNGAIINYPGAGRHIHSNV